MCILFDWRLCQPITERIRRSTEVGGTWRSAVRRCSPAQPAHLIPDARDFSFFAAWWEIFASNMFWTCIILQCNYKLSIFVSVSVLGVHYTCATIPYFIAMKSFRFNQQSIWSIIINFIINQCVCIQPSPLLKQLSWWLRCFRLLMFESSSYRGPSKAATVYDSPNSLILWYMVLCQNTCQVNHSDWSK